MDTAPGINAENDSLQTANLSASRSEECSQPLKFAMQDVQEHFKKASQTILNRIDEMGSRIDQLEFMLNDLISEVESSSPLKNEVSAQRDADCSEARPNDPTLTESAERILK